MIKPRSIIMQIYADELCLTRFIVLSPLTVYTREKKCIHVVYIAVGENFAILSCRKKPCIYCSYGIYSIQ